MSEEVSMDAMAWSLGGASIANAAKIQSHLISIP